MKTRDIVTILLKSAGIGLISTATVVGAVTAYSTVANAGTSIPKDGDECLDVFENLKKLDTARVLWSLLTFAPGFLFGSLYFLCRLPGSVCPDQTSEYETIEDNHDASCLKQTLNDMSNSLEALMLSDNPFKVLFKAIIAGLSALGLINGIVTVSTTHIDRKIFLPEECQEDLRGDIILDIALSIIMLVTVCGPLLLAGCARACSSKTESPSTQVRLIGLKDDDPTASGVASNDVVRSPYINSAESTYSPL